MSIRFNYPNSLNHVEVFQKYALHDTKRLVTYDNNGNWLEESVFWSGANSPLFTNKFIRNANQDPTIFDYYDKPDVFSPVSHYQLSFSYKTVNGFKEVTVADTNYFVYRSRNYYRVTFDAAGYPSKKQLLEWSESRLVSSVEYFYDAESQISKTIITDSSVGDRNVVKETRTFTRDARASNSLHEFAKSIKGKNFWWFDHDKDYHYYHLGFLDDFFTMGKPCTEILVNTSTYEDGVLKSSIDEKVVYRNKYDAHGNLISFTHISDGYEESGSITYIEL